MSKMIVLGFLLMPFSLLLNKQPKSNLIQSSSAPSQSVKDGEAVYKKYCISCHQADGSGVPHMAPPLIKTKYVLGEKEDLIKIVLNGLKGVEINEQAYYNPMPPWGPVLKDKEIADVLTYVRNNFGNKASAISPSEVKEVRSKLKNVSK